MDTGFKAELRIAAMVAEAVGLGRGEQFDAEIPPPPGTETPKAKLERQLAGGLRKRFRPFRVQTSESEFGNPVSELSWVVRVDPPIFQANVQRPNSVSVALCWHGDPIAAVTFLPDAPIRERFCTAFEAGDASVGMNQLKIPWVLESGGQFCASVPLDIHNPEQTGALHDAAIDFDILCEETESNAAALAHFIAGSTNAVVVLNAPRSDVLAQVLIAQKAGAQFIGLDGQDVDLSRETLTGFITHPFFVSTVQPWVEKVLGIDQGRSELALSAR